MATCAAGAAGGASQVGEGSREHVVDAARECACGMRVFARHESERRSVSGAASSLPLLGMLECDALDTPGGIHRGLDVATPLQSNS